MLKLEEIANRVSRKSLAEKTTKRKSLEHRLEPSEGGAVWMSRGKVFQVDGPKVQRLWGRGVPCGSVEHCVSQRLSRVGEEEGSRK